MFVNNGNVTSNTVQFANSETAFVTFANVGICNVDPVHNLDVGSNLYVVDEAGEDDILTVTGNVRSYYFKGDGRYLTNVPVCSICSTFNYVTNIGNITANTVRFVENTVSLITESNVGIAMGTGTDVAIESAGITLVKGDLQGIVKAHNLSQKVMKNIKQNLFFALIYNSIGVPVAAGILFPFFGILLSPMIAALAMSFSSVSVISNALRLRRINIDC